MHGGQALSDSVGFYMPWITGAQEPNISILYHAVLLPEAWQGTERAPAFSEFLKHYNVRHTWMITGTS